MDRIREILEAIADANRAALSADQLAAYRTELSTFVRNRPDALSADWVALATEAASGVDGIVAEITTRTELSTAASELSNRMVAADAVPIVAPVVESPVAEVAPVAAPVAEVPAPVAAPVAEVAPVEVPVAVAASAAAVPPSAITPATPAVPSTPVRHMSLVASASTSAGAAGTPFESGQAAGMALVAAAEQLGSGPEGEKVPVLRYTYQEAFDPDRRLTGDAVENGRKMAKVVNSLIAAAGISEYDEIKARVASGGFCAPLPPDYSFIRVSQDSTPVIDSLTHFNGARGGYRYNVPIPFTAFASTIGIWTEANDIAATPPSAAPRKVATRIACPTDASVRVEAIYRQLEWGNLDARTYPERVADVMAKSMDYMARVRENRVLASMEANSTALTWATVLGAARDIVYGLALNADAFRQRHRTGRDMVMDAWAPFWVRTMMAMDLMRQAPGDGTFAASKAEIDSRLREENISMTWYDDGTTGNNFATLAAGAIKQFPNPVRILVAHPGTHIYIDSGELNLGIVRDSTLNARNDFQVFNEVFQGLATPGFDPVKITFTVCPDGSTSAPVDVAACSTVIGS